ncbi:MAG: response regulator [Desulfobacterales bacterium]|nr:response regulator [Desulfobacterales bacterium]
MQKTLIVEDNTTFRKTFKDALCKRFPSMNIEEAKDGPEALQKVEVFNPDLVFMDIRLPGESGLELMEKIKADHPEIVIIILTDYDLPEYRAAALHGGADDFIPKGALSMSELTKIILNISQSS